jgi:hypothetical protein
VFLKAAGNFRPLFIWCIANPVSKSYHEVGFIFLIISSNSQSLRSAAAYLRRDKVCEAIQALNALLNCLSLLVFFVANAQRNDVSMILISFA